MTKMNCTYQQPGTGIRVPPLNIHEESHVDSEMSKTPVEETLSQMTK